MTAAGDRDLGGEWAGGIAGGESELAWYSYLLWYEQGGIVGDRSVAGRGRRID